MRVKLPDFDDLLSMSERIRELMILRSQYEHKIKTKEAEIMKRVRTEPEYMENGKTPPISFIESVYLHGDYDEGLVDIRKELDEVDAEIDRLNRDFYIMRSMIDVWRTESANQRQATL